MAKFVNRNQDFKADVEAIVASSFPGATPNVLGMSIIQGGFQAPAGSLILKESSTGKEKFLWMDRWGGERVVGR